MPAYRPGKGISSEAAQRLRARMEVGGASLPSVDKSKQWDCILGEGARKKTRCGICTRPLPENEDGSAVSGLVCPDCAAPPLPEATKDDIGSMLRFLLDMQEHVDTCAAVAPLKVRQNAAGWLTPSTEVSEDIDAAVSTPMIEQQTGLKPPTSAQVTLAALKKGLSGAWVGSRGEIYRILFNNETRWTCVLEGAKPSKTFPLSFDQEENVVWWGVARSHFLGAFEVCEQPDQLMWHDAHGTHEWTTDFIWYRSHVPANEAEKFESYAHARESAVQKIEEQLPWQGRDGRVRIPKWSQCYQQWLGDLRSFLEDCPERFKVIPGECGTFTVARAEPAQEYKHYRMSGVEASAIKEIEAQLRAPGSQGFVWVEHWNERYLRQLGSLRSFLDHNPDKFIVIPGRGRGFRVALADRTQAWTWNRS